ncbi:MAG: SDR family NAD(P)-dependent oxidoreductase, partial [Candidatus Sericytochromatia bacterium]|nr:SDR family NAD(P)-dependent oxidoreductase [Candidatus Sericytochromatia bacterium]
MKKKIGLLAAISLGVFAGYRLYKKNSVLVLNKNSSKSTNENVNLENNRQDVHYVLVTGASTGIGKSIAEMLAQQNYKVFSTVRNEQDAEKLAKIS